MSFVKKVGRPRENPDRLSKPNDRLICRLCGKSYTRYNSGKHKNSPFHKLHADAKIIAHNQSFKWF